MRNLRKRILRNQKGQGFTEYILLVAIIVGVVIAFKDPIFKMMNEALGKAQSKVQSDF